jgi:hypothetical protein
MHKRSIVVASLIAMLAVPAWAEDTNNSGADVSVAKAEGEGTVAAGGKVTVSATVIAIDAPTRTVTFKGSRGNIFDVVADDEVKNFDQIKVNDKLTLTYVEAIAFELKKVHSKIRERREVVDSATAKPGDKPAVAVGKRIVAVADVIRVDHKKNTLTLRGPKHTVTIKADPEKLKDVKAGDQVEVTYVKAVALDITSPK